MIEIKYRHKACDHTLAAIELHNGCPMVIPRAFIRGWGDHSVLVDQWWAKDHDMKYTTIVRTLDGTAGIKSFNTEQEALTFARDNQCRVYEWGEEMTQVGSKEETTMPKGTAKVGRTACMDAMCHQCENFNLLGRRDCGKVACPLYAHSPAAKLPPELSWSKLKPRSAVGFVAAKGATPEELLESAIAVTVFRYGSVESAPPEVQAAIEDLASVTSRETSVGDAPAEPTPSGQGW